MSATQTSCAAAWAVPCAPPQLPWAPQRWLPAAAGSLLEWRGSAVAAPCGPAAGLLAVPPPPLRPRPAGPPFPLQALDELRKALADAQSDRDAARKQLQAARDELGQLEKGLAARAKEVQDWTEEIKFDLVGAARCELGAADQAASGAGGCRTRRGRGPRHRRPLWLRLEWSGSLSWQLE